MDNHENDNDDYESDEEAVFLGDNDVLHEIVIDEEVLPDQDDDVDSNIDNETIDDSFYTFDGHTDEVYTVSCSPADASLVATGGKDEKGFLWRVNHDNFRIELQGHKETVSTTAFSSDGQFLASASLDGLIYVWETSTGMRRCSLEGPQGAVEWLKWHPKGNVLLAGSDDCNAWMWNAENAFYLNMFSGHGSSVTCGDFTPDGKTICTGSADASLRIWHPKNAQSIHVIKGHPYHTDGLSCLSISSDSNFVISGAIDGSVHMVNIKTGKVISSLVSHTDSVECIAFSSSGLLAASGGLDGKLVVWELDRSSPRCICEHEEGVTCLTWLGEPSTHVATGCLGGMVRIWDILSGECVRTFGGHENPIQALAVSSDRRWLVSASLDGTARTFSIAEYL